MKKSLSIQLLMVGAALAACNKPVYPQRNDFYTDSYDSTRTGQEELYHLPALDYEWLWFNSFQLGSNFPACYSSQFVSSKTVKGLTVVVHRGGFCRSGHAAGA